MNKELQNILLSLTPNLWITTGLILSIIIAILALIFAVLIHNDFVKFIKPKTDTQNNIEFINMAKKLNTKIKTHISVVKLIAYVLPIMIGLSITLIMMLYAASVIELNKTAYEHGMYQHDLTIREIQYLIDNSPKESILPENINNSLIIYYKFGCSDCTAIYNDLNKKLTNKQVYWEN